jgi:hypothetical protein
LSAAPRAMLGRGLAPYTACGIRHRFEALFAYGPAAVLTATVVRNGAVLTPALDDACDLVGHSLVAYGLCLVSVAEASAHASTLRSGGRRVQHESATKASA